MAAEKSNMDYRHLTICNSRFWAGDSKQNRDNKENLDNHQTMVDLQRLYFRMKNYKI